MNARQRVLNAIAGKPVDRIPVAMHNFPFAARRAGLTIREYMYNPAAAAKALADAAHEFGYDCIIIDFDTCALAEAMGAEIALEGDEPARIAAPICRSPEEVLQLPLPDPARDGRLPLWLETTRELRKLAGDDFAIMARADQGPFALLGLLLDANELLMELLDESRADAVEAALKHCTLAGAAFARAQLAAGSDLTSIGDSLAGESLISPALYRRFAQPCEKSYRESLGGGLLSLHICGKSANIIGDMAGTGSAVLELDHYSDLDAAFRTVANRSCIFGNLDPSAVLARGTPELVRSKSREAIEAAKRHQARFVLCPGCLVMANTPPENLRAMVAAAHDFGQF